jgi:hypothetical protein
MNPKLLLLPLLLALLLPLLWLLLLLLLLDTQVHTYVALAGSPCIC